MMKQAFVVRQEALEGGYRHQQAQTCRGRETGLKTGDVDVKEGDRSENRRQERRRGLV